jgi:hypothetical protein
MYNQSSLPSKQGTTLATTTDADHEERFTSIPRSTLPGIPQSLQELIDSGVLGKNGKSDLVTTAMTTTTNSEMKVLVPDETWLTFARSSSGQDLEYLHSDFLSFKFKSTRTTGPRGSHDYIRCSGWVMSSAAARQLVIFFALFSTPGNQRLGLRLKESSDSKEECVLFREGLIETHK